MRRAIGGALLAAATAGCVAAARAPEGRGAANPEPAEARIVVHPGERLGTVSPLLFGANHRWAFAGFGSWDARTHRAAPGFVERLRESGITTVRFPGGTIANLYHWKNAIGDPAARRGNTHGSARDGQPVDDEFGSDEYGRLTEEIGGVGNVVVNFATGSAAEAAEWVEYMTTPLGTNPGGGTAWAEVRAANGHPAPYDVRYWEVGNEADLAGQYHWRAGASDRDPIALYAFGGTARLADERVARENDYGPAAAISTGAPGQHFHVRYPPVVPGSQTVYVDGRLWRATRDLAGAGAEEVYAFHAESGEIVFGDGAHGAIPPKGAVVTVGYESGPHDGFADFYRAMKAVNPRIQVCAAMTGLEGLGAFARAMGAAHPYDCVTQHPYVVPADVSDSLALHEYRGRLFLQADAKEAHVRAARDSVRRYGGARGREGPAEVVLTEYGHLGTGHPEGIEHYHRSMDEGLLLADNLIAWMRLGVPLADRANLVDFTFAPPHPGSAIVGAADNALLSGPAPHFVAQPTALVMRLFAGVAGGTLVRADLAGAPSIELAGGDRLPALNSVAALDSAGRLHLLVVNHDADRAVTASVSVPGFEHAPAARVRTVAGSGPLASNTPAAPRTVAVEEREVAVGAGDFALRFPVHSVTDVELAPAPPLTLHLWPGTPPGPAHARGTGTPVDRAPDPVRGAITRVTDIGDPTLTLYRPEGADGRTPAVLVFPGGGYQLLATDIEGTEICDWLTESGIACGLVRYRVPQPSDSTRYREPLQDAQRAMGLVRMHAGEWGIDPGRVGVLGFSAGGHVSAVLSNHFARRAYAPLDSADALSARPDFAILVYPAYLVRGKDDARLSPLVEPSAETPPTFLVQTMDDPIGPENSASYAMALDRAGVPAELHLFPAGGHGYGMRKQVGEVAVAWPKLALRWLEGRGIIGTKEVAAGSTFANPLDLDYRFMPDSAGWRTAADPLITLYRGEYYLFATASSGYWHSPNLRDWTLVVPRGLPLDAPAPAVLVDGGRMYYTAHKLGAVYATDDPKGGEWHEVAKLDSYADPMLFRDDDGRVFLYYGSALNGSIRAVQVDPARGFAVVGGPYTLMTADYAHHGWERSGPENLGAAGMAEGFRIAPYVEGPWMTKHGGTYYLQYSAPGTIWKTYADGVYTSKSPTGPFTYAPYSPFSYKPGGFIGGAGHASTFQDREGRYWRVVTMIISVAHKFERRLGIFPAGFDAEGVMRTNTYLGDYPQFLPGVARDPLAHNLAGWMLLSGGMLATASSTLDGHPAALAFDEDIRTRWSARTGAPGEWLQVDLGAPSAVHAMQVNFGEQDARASGRDSSVYERYRIESSDDGRTWSLLVDRSASTRDAPHDYVQLDGPRTARYLRITSLHVAGGGKFALRGLRVFGRGSGAPPAEVAGLTVQRDPRDARNATLRWTPAAGARRYVVRFGIAPEKLYASYEVGADTRLELHSLNLGVPYYFAVDAVNENGVTRGTKVLRAAADD